MRISHNHVQHTQTLKSQTSKGDTNDAPFSFVDSQKEDRVNERPTRDGEKILRPVVASAVESILMQLQHTGSVFDLDDQILMGSREVSAVDRQRYTEIVLDASRTGGFNNAKDYVAALSIEDQRVLKLVNSLGSLSDVVNTNEEGALNLLLPDSKHVDINNDSFINVGKATLFKFPPPNAPDSVKQAWEATVKDLSGSDLLTSGALFFTDMISANLVIDTEGNPTSVRHPLDPDYVNIFPKTESEWLKFAVEKTNSTTEVAKRFPDLEKQVALLEKFVFHLREELARVD